VVVIAIAALRTDKRLDTEFERALRVSLCTLVILGACLALIPHWLRQATWGLVAATWVAAGVALWLSWDRVKRPDSLPQFNAVSYGDLLLLMAVLATFSIGWRLTRFRKTEIAVKALTLVVGLLGFMATQTRGGWLAVPFFIVIGLVLLSGKASPRKLVLPALIAMLIATAVFASSAVMRQRFLDAITQTAECIEKPLAISSECGRIQLWHVSWLMFKADPLFGSGSTQSFRPMVEAAWRQGIVSDFTHAQGFGEPHSDIMFSLASHGLLGLAALLLLYFTPAWIFARRLSTQVAGPARVAAAMGLVVCVGFFVFGWTELILRTLRTLSFYAMGIAWLLALSDERFLKRN
jgi:O-antigen ligase